MFVRTKSFTRNNQTYDYLYLVENSRSNGKVVQKTIMSLGRIDDPKTTGDGTFLLQSDINSLVTCYGSEQLRCDGFLVDPPPHNLSYFEDQIEATKNYFLNISKNNIESFNYQMIDSIYQLDKKMSEYSEMSSYDNPEEAIALLYSEGLELASLDIEALINDNDNN